MNALDAVAAIRAAADNAALVMPPLAAKHLRRELLAAATAIEASRDELANLLAAHWAERVDEINAYAARATEFIETEAFWGGADPATATHSVPAQTVDEALKWSTEWAPGIGVAHRTSIRLNGPWEIDRPAASTIKETAA